MAEFNIHTHDTAPEASKTALQETEKSYGFLPNLYGVFAESPAALKAYGAIGEVFDDDTAFDATEKQVVLLAVSALNGCDYCVAAHSTVAEMVKAPDEVVQAIRSGSPIADAKLQALRAFTEAVVHKSGRPAEADLQAFFEAGYEKRHVLDVLVGVAQKTLSNYTNHIAETPLDDAFQKNAWKKAA